MKLRAYIDIETTGLSRYYAGLTIIGIGFEKGRSVEVTQFIEDDLYEKKLLRVLKPKLLIIIWAGTFTCTHK